MHFFVDRYYTLFKKSNNKIPVKMEYKKGENRNVIYIYALNRKNRFRGAL